MQPLEPLDDRTLVAAALSGDKDAFAELLARNERSLQTICRRMLREEHLAEDARQETALRSLLALPTLKIRSASAPGSSALA